MLANSRWSTFGAAIASLLTCLGNCILQAAPPCKFKSPPQAAPAEAVSVQEASGQQPIAAAGAPPPAGWTPAPLASGGPPPKASPPVFQPAASMDVRLQAAAAVGPVTAPGASAWLGGGQVSLPGPPPATPRLGSGGGGGAAWGQQGLEGERPGIGQPAWSSGRHSGEASGYKWLVGDIPQEWGLGQVVSD